MAHFNMLMIKCALQYCSGDFVRVYMIEDLERALLGREPAECLKLVTTLDNLSSADYKT